MRKVEIGRSRFTEVFTLDETGAGGAHHQYEVLNKEDHSVSYASVRFQNGPIKESGVNGCHQEDLIAIVIDRLECFQMGDFACAENAEAISSLREALGHLNARTADRSERGVEGLSEL